MKPSKFYCRIVYRRIVILKSLGRFFLLALLINLLICKKITKITLILRLSYKNLYTQPTIQKRNVGNRVRKGFSKKMTINYGVCGVRSGDAWVALFSTGENLIISI